MTSLRTLKVRSIVFWYALAIVFISLTWPAVRYLVYTIPFLVILAVLGDRDGRLGDEVKPFLFLCLAGAAFAPLATQRGLNDIFFIFSGISVALLIDIPKVDTGALFWLNVISMMAFTLLFKDVRAGFEFDLASSKSTFEGSFSFIFGLLAVVALLERRHRLFLASTILTIVSLKRIAVVGVLTAALFVFLPEKRGRLILNPLVMIVLNSLVSITILLYGLGVMDRPIAQLTGQSADQLGMGRQRLLAIPANAMVRQPFHYLAYGQGPGTGYRDLVPPQDNLHSDLVKIVYEYGYLTFFIFIWQMYSCADYGMRVLFLYVNVLFLTDNTLIYSFLLVIFVTIGRSLQTSAARDARTPVSRLLSQSA